VDGQVIKKIVRGGHNKWRDSSLEDIADVLRVGGSGTTPLKVLYMRLGSTCSDTSFTAIVGTQQSTVNTDEGVKQTKFTANWPSSGSINGICQVALEQKDYVGSGYDYASYYNFGTSFSKPNGVALKIEWTTTLATV